jgi:2-polyprenyl-6-methoxyphenol hydroxylase-like FAD-dependent oxidoreductase
MSSKIHEPILVVGAGPVGLSMALALKSMEVPVRIIDRVKKPTELSKALVVWARTLEVLDGTCDADRFMDAGIRVAGADIHRSKGLIAQVDLADVPSRFGAGVLLPQSETERILIERLGELGVTVERDTELLDSTDEGDHVLARLRQPSGEEVTISTPWLIGCDGAHSTVRHGHDLTFTGSDDPAPFVLGDVHVDGDLPNDRVSIFFSSSGITALFPIVGGRFRMIANMPGRAEESKDTTLEELQSIVDDRVTIDLRLHDPEWLAVFRIRERVLDDYRVGRCLLAGDAAHVHSPVGGQGMNTGIQDAMNLAWKLAMHQRGLAGEALVDSYSEERSAVGHKVVSATTRATGVATTANPLLQGVRNAAMHFGLRFPVVQEFLARNLSMVTVNYRDTGFRGHDAILRHRGAIHVGDRVPFLELTDGNGVKQPLDAALEAGCFTLLVVESSRTPGFPRAVESMVAAVPESVRSMMRVVAVASCPADLASDSTLVDVEGVVHEHAGFHGHGAILVRPDRYIGLFLGALDAGSLADWFQSD